MVNRSFSSKTFLTSLCKRLDIYKNKGVMKNCVNYTKISCFDVAFPIPYQCSAQINYLKMEILKTKL